MPDWCQKRITSIELKVRFGDGKHRFYLESVCASPVRGGGGGKLCDSCRMLQVQTKTQDVRTFPHGFVLGEYPPESHIFDSPWYHSKVEAYGRPSDTDIALAMEAQKRARSGKTTKAMKDLIDILVAGAKPPSTVGSVEETPEIIVGIPMDVSKEVSKEVSKGGLVAPKTRARGKSKSSSSSSSDKSEVPTTQISRVCTTIPGHIQFVESADDPIEIEPVLVALKQLTYKGVVYWHDTDSQRVYRRGGNGRRADCVGTWDANLACIV
jgi:hypothetical protein